MNSSERVKEGKPRDLLFGCMILWDSLSLANGEP